MNDQKTLQSRRLANILSVILVLFLCFWRVPFLNKGIDYTDTGFSMVNYRNVFYGDGIHGIGVFFTNLLGGLIYRILPAYHLLVFRILHWLLNLCTCLVAYCIFKKYLSRNTILVLLIAISFGVKRGEALFSYYPLTSLILLLSLLLIIKGLTEENVKLIVLSGFFSGFNVFVRLPNVLFLSMALFIVFYGKWTDVDYKENLKRFGLYIGGAIASFVASLALMFLFLGPQSMLRSFMGYVRLAFGQVDSHVENVIGIEEKSGHSLLAEIKTIAHQGIDAILSVILYLLPILLICVLLALLVRKIRKQHTDDKKFDCILFAILSILAASLIFLVKNALFSTITLIVYLFSMFLCLVYLFVSSERNSEGKLLTGLVFLMGCCAVFGSDLGIARMGIINVMLVLNIAYCLQELLLVVHQSQAGKVKKAAIHFLSAFTLILVIAMFVVGIFSYFPYTYLDAPYQELDYSVSDEIKPLNGMKTSKIRAEEINEFYRLMSADELKGKEVAIFGYFPLGFTISEHANYFANSQPCVDYPSVSVRSLLKIINKKEAENVVPVIVVSYVNQLQRGDDHFTSDAKMEVIKYMLSLHEYEMYSDDHFFTIFVPTADEKAQ